MIPSSSDLSARFLYYLAEPAFRALVLAALAGAALALVRARDAAVRLAVWAAVLYAALAMPFLARLTPTVPLPMPAFFRARAANPAGQGRMPGARAGLQTLCENFLEAVIPSEARNLALSVFNAVRDSSSPAASRNDSRNEFSHRL